MDLELLRCPLCKGRLAPRGEHLDCPPCRRGFPVHRGIPDLRVGDRNPTSLAGHAADPAARMWLRIRQAHGELPRQGVALDAAMASPDLLAALGDGFRALLGLGASPEALATLRGELERSTRVPVTLVAASAEALPVASEAIDLVVRVAALPREAGSLEGVLGEAHRVLAPRGHAYLRDPTRTSRAGALDRAARAAFADGYWLATMGSGSRAPRGTRFAVHRHVQAWLGFEYTLGRGIQTPSRSVLSMVLGRWRGAPELVAWRVRPERRDWKHTASDEAMTFGRFHFPEPAAST